MRTITTTPRCLEINKIVSSADIAIADVQSHSTLYVHPDACPSYFLHSSMAVIPFPLPNKQFELIGAPIEQ